MVSEELKQRRHAEAQRKYREKCVNSLYTPITPLTSALWRNLEATRKQARLRMQKKRACRSREEVDKAAQARREGDADYREFRRHQKFVEKHGESKFLEVYFPLYAQLGKKHLPGLKIA
ncbi:hypothetical protein K438DRAFT_1991519 [Mycena galopus ATCC 62051]|nr:hypothetical protein K438DRAFT_1991519 [Mycena galopus ATCC 62051]